MSLLGTLRLTCQCKCQIRSDSEGIVLDIVELLLGYGRSLIPCCNASTDTVHGDKSVVKYYASTAAGSCKLPCPPQQQCIFEQDAWHCIMASHMCNMVFHLCFMHPTQLQLGVWSIRPEFYAWVHTLRKRYYRSGTTDFLCWQPYSFNQTSFVC